MNSKTIFNLLALAVIVVVIFFAYRLFFAPSNSATDQGQAGLVAAGFATNNQETPAATDEFLGILLSLQKLDLKVGTEFFANPVFKSLVDFTTELPERTPGRTNPFSPMLGTSTPSVFDARRNTAPARTTTSGAPTSRTNNQPTGSNPSQTNSPTPPTSGDRSLLIPGTN